MIQFAEHIFQLGWFNHQLDDDGGSAEVVSLAVAGMVMIRYTLGRSPLMLIMRIMEE